jgi:hypothetical protein
MPDYSKLHDLVSHRVTFEYDTGARIVGYLAACQPAAGQVQFAKLTAVELIDASGRILAKESELVVCPNMITGFRLEEGPSGRVHR